MYKNSWKLRKYKRMYKNPWKVGEFTKTQKNTFLCSIAWIFTSLYMIKILYLENNEDENTTINVIILVVVVIKNYIYQLHSI